MTVFTTIATLCALASLTATVLTISACVLSSRMSRKENWVESYEESIATTKASPHSYPVNS